MPERNWGELRVMSPEAFVDYNKTKAGVDLNDQKRSTYTTHRRAIKWWHALFYWVVDCAAIQGHIVLCRVQGRNIVRLDFLQDLVLALCDEDQAQLAAGQGKSIALSIGLCLGSCWQEWHTRT